MKMQNFKLTLCYDGRRYHGWQKQGNTGNTIQAKIESLLSRILAQDIEVAGSGRTDAGVHARAQVCSFRAETSLSPEQLLNLIRRYLPDDIGALSLEYAEPRFHARLSCKEKTYVYRIWNSTSPNVFERGYTYTMSEPLNVPEMEKAAALIIGRHDFSAFCSNRHMKKSAVRELRSIDFTQNGNVLEIALTGNGFLYNMVRIIVGSLIEVGLGKRSADSLKQALLSMDRANSGPTAPAQGLFLWSLSY